MKQEDLFYYCKKWHPKYNTPSLYYANLSYVIVPVIVDRQLEKIRKLDKALGDVLYTIWSRMINDKCELMHPVRYDVEDVIYSSRRSSFSIVGKLDFCGVLGFERNIIVQRIENITDQEVKYLTFNSRFDFGRAYELQLQEDFVRHLELTYEACCMSCNYYNHRKFLRGLDQVKNIDNMLIGISKWLV